ncbi:fimbrial protein [Salinivibrio kushneri]|uniref:Fimbrial protein n=1 Tax=Salinivibrio kushneri TaxID=1908198 RepID=A0AB36JT88_9GAMM|nr:MULTISPECIES: Flp family type IVb pilin [Salinivibrio]ODP97614.1 fimbrial protein [Salinivibrio sp. BNH]OOE38890.1 fimbrial protein [Salinivibrio kushneri]QCP02817.1 Flp family type IVb pilin [Salinivibrio kushneri]
MLTKLFVNTRLALESFAKDDRGVTAIEYAIIGVAISAIVLAVFQGDGGLQSALEGAISAITSNITAAAANE